MGDLDNSATVEITGKIMVVAIVILFIVVVFVLFLHLYAKYFWWRTEEPTPPTTRRRRRRFIFNPGQEPVRRRGFDPSVLNSLPVIVFQTKEDGKECPVCLSEIEPGEKARFLPKCRHGFHVECIDMWFESHSTCPLCRNSVAPDMEDEVLESGYSSESPNFAGNVAILGGQSQLTAAAATGGEAAAGASSSSGESEIVVIDVGLDVGDGLEEEEVKSPVPIQRLRSLKRLLSREWDKRVAPSTSSSDA